LVLNANVQSQDAVKPEASGSAKLVAQAAVVSEQASVSVAKGINGTYMTHRTNGTNKGVQNTVVDNSPIASEQAPGDSPEQTAQVSRVAARVEMAIPVDKMMRSFDAVENSEDNSRHPVTVGVNGSLSEIYLPIVYTGGSVTNTVAHHVYPEFTLDYELSSAFA